MSAPVARSGSTGGSQGESTDRDGYCVPPSRAAMNTSGVRSNIQFFGFLATLFGALFIAFGLLGLIFAVGDLASSPPIVRSGVVLASAQESPSSNHYSIRVRLDDGRLVMVAEEPSPIDKGVRLGLIVKDGAYEIYDPTGPWVGSLLLIAVGTGIYLVGRKMKVAWT
jgi:hypothetical protein